MTKLGENNYFLVQPEECEETEENYSWACRIYFSQLLHKKFPSQIPFESTWWKPLDKKKTVYVTLVMCLHVGVDPPDITRPSPCARLECWQNPLTIAQPKPAEVIGNALHQQYERMQQRARYRILPDPISEAVSKACLQLRKNARDDRVLFHYNGHGVPKPTSNGEIWVFNKDFTQYMPMCVLDVNKWLQGPTMYVFDCSNAGLIVDTFKNICLQADPTLDLICFGACGREDILPMNPELPADLFTSCLTTPIKIALRWYCLQNPDCLPDGINMESADAIPGKTTDRRTVLGELNWIFTAVTDTIGWSTLPVAMFQRLFRQDNLIAGLSRNFLLAIRILKSYNCTPCSEPEFPTDEVANHPMWKAWDMVCDMCIKHVLPYLLGSEASQSSAAAAVPPPMVAGLAPPPLLNASNLLSSNAQQLAKENKKEYIFSGFFSEQLRAFEIFLTQIKTTGYQKPTLLPIVLQVLLAQNHRPRALELLKQFLEVDVQAVMATMSVGVSPYIARLLSTPSTATPDTSPPLLCIYSKIIALDPSFYSSLEMPKELYISFFQNIMCSPTSEYSYLHKTLAAYIISRLLNHLPEVRSICAEDSHKKHRFIPECELQLDESEYPLLNMWIIICLASLWKSCDVARRAALRTNILEKLFEFLSNPYEELRTAALCALGTFIQNSNLVKENDSNSSSSNGGNRSRKISSSSIGGAKVMVKSDTQMDHTDQKIAYQIIRRRFDISEMVRKELAVSLAHFILENEKVFQAKWQQLMANLSENSNIFNRNTESFCIVNNHDCDTLMRNFSNKSLRELETLATTAEDSTVLSFTPPGDDSSHVHTNNDGGFHVGTPPYGKLKLLPNKSSTPNPTRNMNPTRNDFTNVANSGIKTLTRNNVSLPVINFTQETTEFKDLWDTLICLVYDPSGSVSDIAKQVLKRISDTNRTTAHVVDDAESTQPPRGILRSDSCTNPQTYILTTPTKTGQRKKVNSCDDPTASASRIKLSEDKMSSEHSKDGGNTMTSSGGNHSSKPTVTFNKRQDETYYYYKENPAGYFCTGFIEEYSQLMLEPFHKWPLVYSAPNTKPLQEDHPYYNAEKLKKFRYNAKCRMKAGGVKASFEEERARGNCRLSVKLRGQEQLNISPGSFVNFHFEPYNNSLFSLASSSLWNINISSSQQKMCFDENFNVTSQIGFRPSDSKYLDFIQLNSHENTLLLVANSFGCFKIINPQPVLRYRDYSSNVTQKLSKSSNSSLPLPAQPEDKLLLTSFRGFRVPSTHPIEQINCSWNCWTAKFLACGADQDFEFNLNVHSKPKNFIRVWDLETQMCEYEQTTLLPVSHCLSHHDYHESVPKVDPNIHCFGLTNGAIQIIDTRLGERNRTLREHNRSISYLTKLSEYQLVSAAESVKVWDLRKSYSLSTHNLPQNYNRVTVSHLSSLIATSYSRMSNWFIDISEMNSGKVLETFKIQPQHNSFLSSSKPQLNDVQHIEFHPYKAMLGVAAQNGNIFIYDTKLATSVDNDVSFD